jgi:hypothetical protein
VHSVQAPAHTASVLLLRCGHQPCAAHSTAQLLSLCGHLQAVLRADLKSPQGVDAPKVTPVLQGSVPTAPARVCRSVCGESVRTRRNISRRCILLGIEAVLAIAQVHVTARCTALRRMQLVHGFLSTSVPA